MNIQFSGKFRHLRPQIEPLLFKKYDMIKHIPFAAVTLLLCLLVVSCKNTPSEKSVVYPIEKNDSIVGFKGCLTAGFRASSDTAREFIYQKYLIKARTQDGFPGERIDVITLPDSIRQMLPVDDNGSFAGMAYEHIFIDAGTAPDLRELVLYRIRPEGVISMVFRTKYYPDPAPFVSENGNLWFYAPIEESDMVKTPDCPDKEKWVKDGLRVGYGQRVLYNLTDRMLTRKSEYVCVPLQ